MNVKRLPSLLIVALTALLALVLGLSTLSVNRAQGPADTSDLSLSKVAQAVVLPGGQITYHLTITNSGAQAATDVVVRDVLPPNTTYVSGGTPPVEGTVEWTIPSLAGYGGVETKTLVLAANADAGTTILNDTYSAQAYSGQSATGILTAATRIVDSYVWLTPWLPYTLTYSGPDATTVITLPAGSVDESVTLAYEELDQASHPLSAQARFSLRSFRLSFFQVNRLAPDLSTTDSFSVTMSTSSFGAVGSVEEEQLQLYRWDRGQWSKKGITCWNEPVGDWVSCSIAPQALGEFALTEAEHEVYLPVVLNGYRRY